MPDDAEASRPVFVGVDRFQLLVDAVEEYAIFLLDLSGRVMSWNSGAERIKGYAANEILGRHFSVFYEPHDIAAETPIRELETATAVGRCRAEGWRVRKDGSTFWAHVIITAVRNPDGELTGFAKVTRDETHHRAAETAAADAVAAAIEANASKDRFLSRMSHELRTPLNAILGFGQLMMMDDLPSMHRDSVSHILGAGHHLLALIDDVLDISRMESGEVRLSLEPVRVADVVDEAVGMLGPLSERLAVPIRANGVSRDVYVLADRQRLAQVVLNLVSNALKYNRRDGTVQLDTRTDADGRVRITVVDDGPGIDPEDHDRLFQPFERLAAAQSGIEGTGLGLTLSKTLMTAMRGEIGVDSMPGSGCTFWIALPSTEASDVALPAPTPASTGRGVAEAIPKRVLYIEDNLSNIRLLERVLARRPWVSLLVATLGSTGIEVAFDSQPDLILLDLHLPDMTGDDVLKRLRGDERTARVPVVIVSADATESSPRRLRELGATGFITKPFDIQRLLDLVDGTTSRTNAGARSGARVVGVDPYVVDFVHDLDNSLGVILNYATILSRSVIDPIASADVAEIRTAAEAAATLSRALLEHSRERATRSPM